MWRWYSGDESGPAHQGQDSQDRITNQSMADVAEQLAQTEQLVVHLKELIREKDNALHTKDQEFKSEKESFEAKISKLKLQHKAKVTSLNSQLEEMKKQLTPSESREMGSEVKKSVGDSDHDHAAAKRGKILLLKKKVEDLELQLSQKETELKNKAEELVAQRLRGEEMDALLAEKDKKLSEKEAYIVELHMASVTDNTSRALHATSQDLSQVQLSQQSSTTPQDLELIVKNLTKKVEESEEKCSFLEEQNKSLLDQINTEKKQFDDKENMYKQNIQTFKDIILEKDSHFAEQIRIHEQELFKLASKSDASADLEQLLKVLKQKLHEKEEVLLGRTQVVDVLQKEVDARDNQIKELNEKMRRLQLEKDNMQSKLDAEKHIMRAQIRDLMGKHENEVKVIREKFETELSEKNIAYMLLQEQILENGNQSKSSEVEKGFTVDGDYAQRIVELEAQAKAKTEEASKSEAKYLKMKAWSKSKIKQLEDELRKAQSGSASLDIIALRNKITELEEERDEVQEKLDQYHALKRQNDELMAKLELYEEQQRKLQADLEQVTKRAASQTSESGSADELQSQVLEWQEMISEAEAARDQAREEKSVMVLRMTQIEEEREGLIEDDWFFPGCSDPALVTRQQELEEELAQAQGLQQQRRGHKQAGSSTPNHQDDFEFDGKQCYENPNITLESNDSADGENMGGWWPEYTSPHTGLRSVVEELELERNQLQEQILVLEERCQNLEDRLQLQARIESLQVTFDVDEERQQFRVTQSETERLQSQLANVRSQQTRDAEKHHMLVSNLNEQLKGINEKNDILEMSLTEKVQMLFQTSAKLEETENLRDALKEREIYTKELGEKLGQSELNLSEMTKKCNTLESKCSELTALNTDLLQKLTSLKEKSQKQEVVLEELQQDLDQTNEELDKLNTTHLEERSQLIHDLQSCEREIDNLKDVVSEKEKEIVSLTANMSEYSEQVLQLKQQIRYKEEEIGEMETALNNAERQAQIIKETQSLDEQTVNSKLSALLEQLQKMETDLNETRTLKEGKCIEVEELLKQARDNNEIIQNLRTEIQKLNGLHSGHIVECEAQIASLKEQITLYSKRIQDKDDQHQSEAESLRSRLEEASNAYKSVGSQLEEKKEMVSNLEVELKTYKDKCNQLTSDLLQKEEELKSITQQLANQLDNENKIRVSINDELQTIHGNRLKEVERDAEEKNNKLNQELQSKDVAYKLLQEDVSRLNTELSALKNEREHLQAIAEQKEVEILEQAKLVNEINERVASILEDKANGQNQLKEALSENEKYKNEAMECRTLNMSQSCLIQEMQVKMNSNVSQLFEYEQIIAGLQKEKEALDLRVSDLSFLWSKMKKMLGKKQMNVFIFQSCFQIVRKRQKILKIICRDTELMAQDQNKALQSGLVENDLALQDKALECDTLQKHLNDQKEIALKLQNEAENLKNEIKRLEEQAQEEAAALRHKSEECNKLWDQITKKSETVTLLNQQIDVMNENTDKLKTENDELKVTVNKYMSDITKLDEQLKVSQAKCSDLQMVMQTLRTENDKLKMDVQDMALTFSQKERELNALNAEISKQEDNLALLKKQLAEVSFEKETLLKAVQEKEECLSQKEMFIKQIETTSVEEKKQFSENMEVAVQLQAQVCEKEQTLQEHMQTIARQEKEIKLLQDKTEECNVLRSEMSVNMEMISSLQGQSINMAENIKQLESIITEKDSLLKQKVDSYISLKAQFSDLEDLVAQLRQQVDSVTAELGTLRKTSEDKELSLVQDKETAKLQIEDLNSKLRDKGLECDSLKEQLSNAQEATSKLAEKLEIQSLELSSFKELVTEKEISLSEQTRMVQFLKEKEEEATLFKSQLVQSTESLADLQNQLEKQICDSQRMTDLLSEKQRSLLELQEQYALQSKQLQDISTSLLHKTEEVSALDSLIFQKDNIIKTAENESSALKNEISCLRAELESSSAAYSNLLQEKDAVSSSNQTKCNALVAEIEALKTDLQQNGAQINLLTQVVEQKEHDITFLSNKCTEHCEQLDHQNTQIKSLNESSANLKQQLELAINKNTLFQQEVNKLAADRADLETQFKNQIREMEDKFQILSAKKEDLMKEVESQQKIVHQELQKQVSVKDEEIAELKLEIQKVEHTLVDSEKEWLADLDRENHRYCILAEQLRTAENEMKVKDVKIQALQKDLDELLEKDVELSSSLKVKIDQLAESNVSNLNLSQQIAHCQNTIDTMVADIKKKDEQYAEIEQVLSEREKEVEKLKAEKVLSQQDLSEVSQSLSNKLLVLEEERFSLQAEIKQLKSQLLTEKESLIEELDKNNLLLKSKLSELLDRERDVQDARHQVSLMQEQLNNAQEEIKISHENLNITVKEKTQLALEIQKKEEQIQSQTMQLNQQKELLSSLSIQLREKDFSVAQLMESISNEVIKHTEEKTQLTAKLQDLEKKYFGPTQELQSLYEQHKELEKRLSTYEALIESHNAEKKDLLDEKEELHSRCEALVKERDTMKKKLQAALLARKELLKKMGDIESKSQADFNKLKECEDVQSSFHEISSKTLQTQSIFKEHESQIAHLKQQLIEKERDVTELSQAIIDKQSCVNLLEKELHDLKSQMFESESQLDHSFHIAKEKYAVIENVKITLKENEAGFEKESSEHITEHAYVQIDVKKEEIQKEEMSAAVIKKSENEASGSKTLLEKEKEVLEKKLHAALLARRETLKKSQEKDKKHKQELTQLQETIKRLELQHSEKTEELQKAKDELSSMHQDYNCKIKEFESNRGIIEGLQRQLNSITVLLEDKEKTLQDLKDQLKEQENKMLSALQQQDEVEFLQNEITTLTCTIADKDKSLKTLENNCKDLGLELKEVKSKLNTASLSLSQKDEQLKNLQSVIDSTQQEHTLEEQALLDKCAELQTQLRKAQDVTEGLKIELTSTNRDNDTRLETLRSSNDMLLKENEELRGQLSEAQSLIADFKEETLCLKASLLDVQCQFNKEKEDLQFQAEKLEGVWQQCKTEAESMKLQLESEQKEKEAALGQLESSRTELCMLEERVNHLEKVKADLNKMINSLQEEAAKYHQDSVQNLHIEKVKLLQSEVDRLEVELKEKEMAVISLKETITQKEALEMQMKFEFSIHEEEKGRLKREVNELQQNSAKSTHTVKTEEQEIASKMNEQITRKLQAALISRKELLKENKILKDQNQALLSEKEQVLSTLSSLQESAVDMDKKLKDLMLVEVSLTNEKERLKAEMVKILSENHSLNAACESLKYTIENITQQKQAFSCQLESLKDSQALELSEWKTKHTELKQEYESLLQAYENISSEMGKMSQMAEAARKEKQEMMTNMYKVDMENEALEMRLKQANEEKEKLNKELRNLSDLNQQRICDLEEGNERLKKEQLEIVKSQQCSIEQLGLENSKLKEDLNVLKDNCRMLDLKVQQLTTETNTSLRALESLKSEKNQSEDDLQSRLCEAIQSKDLLNAEIQSQKNEIAAQAKTIEGLENEKNILSNKYTELETNYKEEIGKKVKCVEQLQCNINSSQQEAINLNEKVKILEDDKILLQEELENLQEMYHKVKTKNDFLETNLHENSEKIYQFHDIVSKLESQNKFLSSQLSEVKEEKCNVIREKDEEQVKLMKVFENKLKAAQRGSEDTKNVTRDLQELLREKHQELNQLQKDCIKYQELILDLERSVKISQSERNTMENELTMKTEKVSEIKKEIVSFKELLYQSKKDYEKVEAENSRLKDMLEQKSLEAEQQFSNRQRELEKVIEEQKVGYEREKQINKDREKEMSKAKEDISKLKRDSEDKTIIIKKLESELAKTIANLAAVSQSWTTFQSGEGKAEDLKQWEIKFQKVIQDKDKQLLDLTNTVQKLRDSTQLKDAQIKEMRNNFTDLEATSSAPDSKYKASSAGLKQLAEELKKNLEKEKSLNEKLEKAKNLIAQQLAQSEHKIANLEANLQMMENKFFDSEANLQKLHAQSDRLQIDLEKHQGISLQLRSLLGNKDAEISMLLSSRNVELSGYLEQIQNHHRLQVVTYEERLKRLYDEKEQRQEEFRDLENKLKSLQIKAEKSVQEKDQMAVNVESLKNAMMSLQNDRDCILSEYKKLKEQYELVSVDSRSLIEEEAIENAQMKRKINSLLHDMDDLHSENAMLKAHLIRYREDLNQVLSLKDNQLKELLQKQLDSIKNLENEKSFLGKRQQDVQQELQQTVESVNKLKMENEKLKSQVQDLQGIISTMQQEKSDMKEAKMIIDLQEEVSAKTTECKRLKEEMNINMSTIRQLENDIVQIEKETDKKIAECEADCINKIAAFERDVEVLRKRMETAEARVVDLANDLAQTEETLAQCKTENKLLKSQNEAFGKAMGALQNDRDRLIEDFKILQAKYDEELKLALANVSKQEFNNKDLTSQVRGLEKENAALNLKLSAFENKSTNSQLISQIGDLCKSAADKDNEIQILVSQNESLNRQILAFSKSMASLQHDRERLLQELDDLKKDCESRKEETVARVSVESFTQPKALGSSFSEITEKEMLVSFGQGFGVTDSTSLKNKVEELQALLQQEKRLRQQAEQDVSVQKSEFAELRKEKNMLITESQALRMQLMSVAAEKDKQKDELQKLSHEVLSKESRISGNVYPVKIENVSLIAKENTAGSSDLQRCLEELHQKDIHFQQLNTKLMQTMEEKMALSTQLKAITQTLRDTQVHYTQLQNRCYWLESQLHMQPLQDSFEGQRQGESTAEVPPGAPQERASTVSLDIGELVKRLAETEQLYDSTQQELSQMAESLLEEQTRRQAAEEALELVEQRAQSTHSSSSRTSQREYSIQLESDEEHEALLIDPTEHVVLRKVKGGALTFRRWLRGRSLYCSKMLTSRAKSRYFFLTYLLALHIAVLLCVTGIL
ncbi:golgin subfamily B member 1-like [Polypterus senegalus]|uniref:golgin subfamily B member 1-like n=1 Tax=Polypterus senegalus TaxID=55291 RepID=UPI001962BAE2|nr:golgin subfamily B member 1-like [Polypterus senegalus]